MPGPGVIQEGGGGCLLGVTFARNCVRSSRLRHCSHHSLVARGLNTRQHSWEAQYRAQGHFPGKQQSKGSNTHPHSRKSSETQCLSLSSLKLASWWQRWGSVASPAVVTQQTHCLFITWEWGWADRRRRPAAQRRENTHTNKIMK